MAAQQRHGVKRAPISFGAKVALAIALGLAFVVGWSVLSPSSPSADVSMERRSFDSDLADIARQGKKHSSSDKNATAMSTPFVLKNRTTKANGDAEMGQQVKKEVKDRRKEAKNAKEIQKELKDQNESFGSEANEEKEAQNAEKEANGPELAEVAAKEDDTDNSDDINAKPGMDVEAIDDSGNDRTNRKKKDLLPLFDRKAHYQWRQCSSKSGHHYIPCVNLEGDGSKHHHERSCPRSPTMCLVSLPTDYREPGPWPDRESKLWYNNIGHPSLSGYIRKNTWLNMSGQYLMLPKENSEFKGGALPYVVHISEMVPDIVWGSNIRVVLDVGCTSGSFGAALLEKNAISLSLGLMSDQTNLGQLALERGIPAVVAELGSRRLPFPTGSFDAIHCGNCKIPWHLHGGRLLIELNRILRPGGYFLISTKHVEAENDDDNDIDDESTTKGRSVGDTEQFSSLMAALCWHVISYEVDDSSDMAIKVYQRPSSNDVYQYRRTKEPPICKGDGNNVAVWYAPIGKCLHRVPQAIEDRGSNWPEEWPKRLKTFPEWLGEKKGRLAADLDHWKAIVERSYIDGMGINWTNVRNIMDMRSMYGGFASVLVSQKVWVMNVVPVHGPDTLPVIFERGLVGMYHDWCEPFSSYPRSYDLLHADHLFSSLKRRCKKPVAVVVEMDRLLRPGGWAIVRDTSEILDSLELILKSLHWDITMTFGKDKEGVICAQKTTWRP